MGLARVCDFFQGSSIVSPVDNGEKAMLKDCWKSATKYTKNSSLAFIGVAV